MILAFLTMITALSISAVAIYYSVAGLVAIFAAAAVPIMIMGSVLEISKLITAVWLHKYWKEAAWWLKSYLSVAVLVLMIITSMGIFGFLSKAHIEQTANAQEGLAQIERIVVDIERQQDVIARAEERILDIESKGSNNDTGIQKQIDTEQQRIDSAYTRIQPAIDEQLAIVSKAEQELTARVQPLIDQATTIETNLTNLSTALANNEVRVAQGIVGAQQDGSLGPNTSAKIQAYREAEEAKRTELLAQVEKIRTAPQTVVISAREEISRLRNIAEQQIADSDRLISRLREQLGTEDTTAVASAVLEQQTTIIEANNTIDALTKNKYTLEAEYRKLEAEVGPIKYIAEFVYGNSANKDMLEEAVRWVIILIIFVFDPLAVLLLIASQYTFEFHKQNKNRVQKEQERIDYEQARAQRIVDNPGYQTGGQTEETKNEITTRSNNEQPDKTGNQTGNSETDDNSRTVGTDTAQTEKTGSSGGDVGTEDMGRLDSGQIGSEQDRANELEELEKTESFKHAKQKWKEENPEATIKEFKDAYIKGKIKELPWSEYIQNSEQDSESIWQRIRKKLDE